MFLAHNFIEKAYFSGLLFLYLKQYLHIYLGNQLFNHSNIFLIFFCLYGSQPQLQIVKLYLLTICLASGDHDGREIMLRRLKILKL